MKAEGERIKAKSRRMKAEGERMKGLLIHPSSLILSYALTGIHRF
jgi:hypothetical protein